MQFCKFNIGTCLTITLFAVLIIFIHSDIQAQTQGALPSSPASDSQLVMPPLPPSAPGTEVTVAPSVPSQSDDLLEGQNDPSVLQRFPLDNFSLSAIVVANNPDNNIAMLEYGGVGYTVRKGSRVQGGVVKEITPTSIIIEVSNTAGNTYGSNTYEISLPD